MNRTQALSTIIAVQAATQGNVAIGPALFADYEKALAVMGETDTTITYNNRPSPPTTLHSLMNAKRDMEAVKRQDIRRLQNDLNPLLSKPLTDDAAEIILSGNPGKCKYLPEGAKVFQHGDRMVFLLPSSKGSE